MLLLPVSTGAGIGYVLGGALGSGTAGRITLDSTELDRAFRAGGTPAAELILGALGVTGSIDIAGTVSLATNGASPRLGQLTLLGDGALTQGAGTSIDVAALRAIFPNGAVLLDPGGAGNRIAALEGVVAGGAVNIRGGAGMMELRDGGAGAAVVAGPGRDITLRADDLDVQAAVQAPGGIINILPETAGRTVTLGGAGAGTLALIERRDRAPGRRRPDAGRARRVAAAHRLGRYRADGRRYPRHRRRAAAQRCHGARRHAGTRRGPAGRARRFRAADRRQRRCGHRHRHRAGRLPARPRGQCLRHRDGHRRRHPAHGGRDGRRGTRRCRGAGGQHHHRTRLGAAERGRRDCPPAPSPRPPSCCRAARLR